MLSYASPVVALIITSSISITHGFTTRLPTFTPQTYRLPVSTSKLELPTFRTDRFSPLFLSWGPEPTWSQAKIESVTPASSNSVSVTISVPSDVAEEFAIPGQYVQLKPTEDSKPLFLAIASPPSDSSTFEFLIKKTESNDWITSLTAAETTCLTSQVMGGGFPMKENLDSLKYDFPTQNVILFATGSGIAPIRSVIESNALNLNTGRTARLYYGCKSLDEMAFKERFEQWEGMGVEVVPVLSQEEWNGRMGYVQTALEEDGVPIPRNSGALMCGVKGMCEAVKDILLRSGVFEGRVMTNF